MEIDHPSQINKSEAIHLVSIHTICAVPDGEAFLLLSPAEGVLVDAGYDHRSAALAAKVRDLLGERPLRGILVTHSHYDHISGCPGVQRLYPDAPVVASATADALLQKPSVRDHIRRMNAIVRRGDPAPHADQIDSLAVDRPLRDGQRLSLGAFRVVAYETPGHTKCSMSYHLPDEDILVCSESSGVRVGSRLLPAFISSYSQALESIAKCAAIGAHRLVVPHFGELDDAGAAFFPQARAVAEQAAASILAHHDRGLDQPAIVDATIAAFFPDNGRTPPASTMLNVTAMVAKLLEHNRRTKRSPAT